MLKEIEINPRDFCAYLNGFSYKEHGDKFEKEYGGLVSNKFPNCENFWKLFVIPLTKRIESYPDSPVQSIDFRQHSNHELEDVAISHYSMFQNLVFAHAHVESKELATLEDTYIHLVSTCDLAESVLEQWYFVLLKCRGEKSTVLQCLTRDEFLNQAGNWYDDGYKKYHEYYLSKGKSPPYTFPARDNIMAEYLGKDSPPRKEYSRHSQAIRGFRNVVVHNSSVARIVSKDGIVLIPKPQLIQKYKTWREIRAVLKNDKIIATDFVEQYSQALADVEKLEEVLNDLWDKLIADFTHEFYSSDRDSLRTMFNVQFSRPGMTILGENSSLSFSPTQIAPSGIFTGGTIEFPK